jgi:RsiW-degrading membrane proteinase PrsW (M82 family)
VAVIRLGLLYGFMVALGFGAVSAACYATTTPVQTCAENPHQEGCLAPIHDQRADAGR